MSSSAAAPTAGSRICAPPPQVVRARKVAPGIKQALVVPGSGLVKRQAEAEGLDRLFIEAGFEWREPGCSMCLAMNPDKVPAGERCASTSNRNFVGRQGPGRTDPPDVAGHGRGGRGHRPHCRRARARRLMAGISRIEGRAIPFGRANVDTDLIIPAAHLKTVSRLGLGRYAFEPLRREPGNVFDEPDYCRCADPDRRRQFRLRVEPRACGLGALRARHQGGDRAELFRHLRRQCLPNGLVTVELPPEAIDRLLAVAGQGRFSVDLEAMEVSSAHGDRFAFALDPFRRDSLMKADDEIGFTLTHEAEIAAHEAGSALRFPAMASPSA